MSQTVILIAGSLTFAVTTCAVVITGGLALGRVTDRDRDERRLATVPVVLPKPLER